MMGKSVLAAVVSAFNKLNATGHAFSGSSKRSGHTTSSRERKKKAKESEVRRNNGKKQGQRRREHERGGDGEGGGEVDEEDSEGEAAELGMEQGYEQGFAEQRPHLVVPVLHSAEQVAATPPSFNPPRFGSHFTVSNGPKMQMRLADGLQPNGTVSGCVLRWAVACYESIRLRGGAHWRLSNPAVGNLWPSITN